MSKVNYINASRELGHLDNLSYFSDNLAQLQEEKGEYKEALKNYKIAQQITDSIYSQESKNNIATLKNAKKSVKEQSLGLASIKERIDMINKQQSGNPASFTIGPGSNQRGTIAVIFLPVFS